MNIKENIVNFLYDKKYFINIYDNYIHIFNYKNIIKIKDNNMEFSFDDFDLSIKGNNLFVKKMVYNEILIHGVIESVGYKWKK